MHNGFSATTCRCCRYAIFIAAMLTTGCTQIDWRGDGLSDPLVDLGNKLRPVTGMGDQFGATSKAREIERNLGYE